MVQDSRILFRYGVTNLIQFSQEKDVPLYICSAGVKEIISASFRQIVDDEQHQKL